MSNDAKKACPLRGNNQVSCEGEAQLELTDEESTEVFKESIVPCHFYNPNTRQCVIYDISDHLRDIPQALSFLSLQLRQPMKPTVVFNDHKLFIDEVKQDQMVIYKTTVRGMIKEYQAEPYHPRTYEVYSAYIAGDQIIKLSQDCQEDAEAATKIMDEIEAACIDACVSFRPGIMKES